MDNGRRASQTSKNTTSSDALGLVLLAPTEARIYRGIYSTLAFYATKKWIPQFSLIRKFFRLCLNILVVSFLLLLQRNLEESGSLTQVGRH